MGMIEGRETLRQAGQKVLLGIIQDFIQARIRMVADWAAGVATQVATTQTGEVAKTAAVTTGVTARTAAESAGAASSLAASAGSMIAQILADAKAAFAGVFGFLAPVMGPAAAGPAASAMATVGGMAKFRGRLLAIAVRYDRASPSRRDDRAGRPPHLGRKA